MTKIAIQPSGSGTGTFTIAAPDSNTNRTFTLPDATGEVLTDAENNPAKLFRRDNILGTVSQSGGVPTGAIIERGSNANGEFVKYADGTMICTHLISESRSSSGVHKTDWTLPAAFVDTTSYFPSAIAATSRPDVVLSVTGLRVTASLMEIYVDRTSSTNTSIYVQAIGRWF